MRNLKLKEVAEMVYNYTKENKVGLLDAYKEITKVLQEVANPYSFEQVKQYIFDNPTIQS